ncbi:Protein kinase domain [Trypanosoma vivax]|uniref:Protein kinase domain-containing protein n=1 Tax=Trypanosoma vivax (strain Y486) TaxID=1055687 RepID=G0TRZ2_TRYVY|nr:putative protein kinase [Trypanosoma vivax]KAH8617337.1 Protein kinase domain [Trypanosoma vivax]CCC46716.1 putative protein kinase [Trypanosoma vivax Y486]
MAEQLRKRIEALKLRKAAAEDALAAPKPPAAQPARAESPPQVPPSASVNKAAPSLPLANLPPAFMSPHNAVVKYRDSIKDPLCAPFSTGNAVALFRALLGSFSDVAVSRGKRGRSPTGEDEVGGSTRTQSNMHVSVGQEQQQQQQQQQRGHVPDDGRQISLDAPNEDYKKVNTNGHDTTSSSLRTVAFHFFPHLKARCFTNSAKGEGNGNDSSSISFSKSPDAIGRPGKTARDEAGSVIVSGKLHAPCRSVNNYAMVCPIAHGVYGVVYSATERQPAAMHTDGATKRGSRMFALKQVRKRWLAESEVGFPPYLLREFDLLLRLRHPNIVRAREVVLLDKVRGSDEDAERGGGLFGSRNETPPHAQGAGEGAATMRGEEMRKMSENCDNSNHSASNVEKPSGDAGEVQQKLPRVSENMRDVYLVMEHCPYDLKSFMYRNHEGGFRLHLSSRNTHPDAPKNFLSRVKCVMQQLFSGLAFLHDHRILHRDIKTSNILISSEGLVKLCDFGLARLYREGQDLTTNVVTLMYRAPELHFGLRDYSYRLDVWSLACIMAELFLQEPLFHAEEEARHFACICDTIGIPTEETFSGLYKLQDAVRVMRSLKQYNRDNKLSEVFARSPRAGASTLPPSGLDLLQRILRWNPMERLSAREALNHEFFREDPLPCSPDELLRPLPSAVVAGGGASKQVTPISKEAKLAEPTSGSDAVPQGNTEARQGDLDRVKSLPPEEEQNTVADALAEKTADATSLLDQARRGGTEGSGAHEIMPDVPGSPMSDTNPKQSTVGSHKSMRDGVSPVSEDEAHRVSHQARLQANKDCDDSALSNGQ